MITTAAIVLLSLLTGPPSRVECAQLAHLKLSTSNGGAAVSSSSAPLAKRCAVALAALSGKGVGCARPARRCKTPTWDGEKMTASDVALWSATLWAFDADSTTAVSPCGGELACAEVAAYIRELGGRVMSDCPGDCAVFWVPPAEDAPEPGS